MKTIGSKRIYMAAAAMALAMPALVLPTAANAASKQYWAGDSTTAQVKRSATYTVTGGKMTSVDANRALFTLSTRVASTGADSFRGQSTDGVVSLSHKAMPSNFSGCKWQWNTGVPGSGSGRYLLCTVNYQ